MSCQRGFVACCGNGNSQLSQNKSLAHTHTHILRRTHTHTHRHSYNQIVSNTYIQYGMLMSIKVCVCVCVCAVRYIKNLCMYECVCLVGGRVCVRMVYVCVGVFITATHQIRFMLELPLFLVEFCGLPELRNVMIYNRVSCTCMCVCMLSYIYVYIDIYGMN